MRIGYVAAGAGGMYCGTCIHDNTVAASLQEMGHEVALLPTYTPMRTDEESVSEDRVFFGALNVYLQQKSALFRKTPERLDRWLDSPRLLRWVARLGSSTDASELGDLTLSVLRGEDGRQRKELDKLAAWLKDSFHPDVIQLTNSMFLGFVTRLREHVGVPVVVAFSGEDLFLDGLPEKPRRRVLAELRSRANDPDLYIAPSREYANRMAAMLEIDPQRVEVVPLGIQLDGYEQPAQPDPKHFTIGYLARICPEKGLHHLLEAFRLLHSQLSQPERLRLRIAGYLGGKDRAYWESLDGSLRHHGLAEQVEFVGEVTRAEKIEFLRSLDLLSVPTVYRESKGLFALEAMAAGVPVLLPNHGSFPEMIAELGGGVLVQPNSPEALAEAIQGFIEEPERFRTLGEQGRRAVHEQRHARAMAEQTLAIYESVRTGEAVPSATRAVGT